LIFLDKFVIMYTDGRFAADNEKFSGYKRRNLPMAYKINAEECIACGACADGCPVEAISAGDAYSIDPEKCIDCGACADTCPVGAPKAE